MYCNEGGSTVQFVSGQLQIVPKLKFPLSLGPMGHD
jgi:hypothetical protein